MKKIGRVGLAACMSVVLLVAAGAPSSAAETAAETTVPIGNDSCIVENLPEPTPGVTITVGGRQYRVPSISAVGLCVASSGTSVPIPFAGTCGSDCAYVGVSGLDYVSVEFGVCPVVVADGASLLTCDGGTPISVPTGLDHDFCVAVTRTGTPPACDVVVDIDSPLR